MSIDELDDSDIELLKLLIQSKPSANKNGVVVVGEQSFSITTVQRLKDLGYLGRRNGVTSAGRAVVAKTQ